MRGACQGPMMFAKGEGESVDEAKLLAGLDEAVKGVVQLQIECGVDSINDGEQSKTNFSNYAKERLGGTEVRTYPPGEGPEPQQG
jgi:5-methyltetrahydropteroyltriglutamate--homocysteine methyltransferase